MNKHTADMSDSTVKTVGDLSYSVYPFHKSLSHILSFCDFRESNKSLLWCVTLMLTPNVFPRLQSQSAH